MPNPAQTLPGANTVLTPNRKAPVAESCPRAEHLKMSILLGESMQSQEVAPSHLSNVVGFPLPGRLLTAREVAARLSVSERWVRDHTTRRSPKIRGVKLGTLMRYRVSDVDEFMDRLDTSGSSRVPRFGR
jgi:excisionase family DNA binding protein